MRGQIGRAALCQVALELAPAKDEVERHGEIGEGHKADGPGDGALGGPRLPDGHQRAEQPGNEEAGGDDREEFRQFHGMGLLVSARGLRSKAILEKRPGPHLRVCAPAAR